MAQEILRQDIFVSGELDPQLDARTQLKAYSTGLAKAENVWSRPQGGFGRRPGLRFISRVRSKIEAVSLAAATFSTTQGGSPSQLSAADAVRFRTTSVMGAGEYVIAQIVFPAPQTVDMVDLVDYLAILPGGVTPAAPSPTYPWGSASDGLATVSAVLKVQYFNGGWQDFGAAQDLGTLMRTRRVSPAPGVTVTAAQWRIVKMASVDWGGRVFEMDAIRFWRETGELSPARLWRFTFDTDTQLYQVVVTDRNAEVYRNDERLCAFGLPYLADEMLKVRRTQSLDTLLAFHVNHPPLRITRQGAHDQWDVRDAVFKNIPKFDYDGTNAGAVNEKQDIKFKDYVDGNTFTLTYEGEETTTLTYITTNATNMATNIQAALEDLPSIGEGNVSVSGPSNNVYRVEFINQMGGGDVSNLAGRTLSGGGSATVYVDIYQRGVEGGEAIMSAARGWPAAGAFYGDRLFMGGFKYRSQSIVASRLGEYFDLDIRGSKSAAGISINLASDVKHSILALHPGPNLQVFTNAGAFYFPTDPIVPPAPAVRRAKQRIGMAAGTPLFEMNGTVFVASGAQSLMEFSYSDPDQSYMSLSTSSLWGHIVRDIVDVGYRQAINTNEPDRALIVRSDGGAAAMWAMSSEEVLGFAPTTTDGAFIAATGEVNGRMYAIVTRQKNGQPFMGFEVFDDDHMLDASVRVTGVVEEITGLSHLEGREVMLYVDGGYEGTQTVADGKVTLPFASVNFAEAGLWFKPRAVTLPGVLQTDPRGGATSRPRAGTIEMKLGPSANLKCGQVGGRMWPVPLTRRPQALLDSGPGAQAYSGWTKVDGIPGFRSDSQVEITQDVPGPMEVKALVVLVNT